MRHLDDGVIHELLDGEIPSSELPPLTAHLEQCGECRERLERAQTLMAEADELVELLDHAPARVTATTATAPTRKRPRWLAPTAWAASIMLAAALGYSARKSEQLLPTQPATTKELVADARKQAIAEQQALVPPSTLTARPEETVLPPPPVMQRNEPAAKAAAPSAIADKRTALAEQPAANDAAGARSELAGAAAPAPAPSVAGALRDRAAPPVATRLDGERRLASEALASKQLSREFTARTDTIGLPDALRLLGGRIRLIDGLVMKRLEAQGTEVRVIYPASTGDLVLSQRLVHGAISWQLIAPGSVSSDSLAKLKALVHE